MKRLQAVVEKVSDAAVAFVILGGAAIYSVFHSVFVRQKWERRGKSPGRSEGKK